MSFDLDKAKVDPLGPGMFRKAATAGCISATFGCFPPTQGSIPAGIVFFYTLLLFFKHIYCQPMFPFPLRCLPFIAAFLLFFNTQGAVPDSGTSYGFSITGAPLQVLVLEIPLQLELKRGRSAFGFSAAYRHRSNGNYDHGGLLDLLGKDNWNADFITSARRAIAAGVNFKYYFREHGRWYGEVQLFYRHWWGDRKAFFELPYYPQYNPDIDITHVYGSKFLIGYTAFLSRKGRVRPVLNAFCGAGLRLHHDYATTVVYPEKNKPSYQLASHETSVWPSFQLGFNIGVFVVSRGRAEAGQ